ncbi:MAG TPA: aminopeptidase P N-terminal domain-containing protein, partial [Candidatus Spyradocola merdavium]|nr:aminopeptidase P N-terminal domain-containing protein [Candidatus Spyradocola merdavium]
MDAQVFVAHRAALEEQLPDNSLLFLFAGEPKQKTLDMDYPFRVDNNYYYMTGFD